MSVFSFLSEGEGFRLHFRMCNLFRFLRNEVCSSFLPEWGELCLPLRRGNALPLRMHDISKSKTIRILISLHSSSHGIHLLHINWSPSESRTTHYKHLQKYYCIGNNTKPKQSTWPSLSSATHSNIRQPQFIELTPSQPQTNGSRSISSFTHPLWYRWECSSAFATCHLSSCIIVIRFLSRNGNHCIAGIHSLVLPPLILQTIRRAVLHHPRLL